MLKMEWLEDYKSNLENPLNIKGFKLLLNRSVFKQGISEEKLSEIESQILQIPHKKNPSKDIKKLLDEIKLPKREKKKYKSEPETKPFVPSNSQFKFLFNEEEEDDFQEDVKNTIDYEIDLLKKEQIRMDIRNLIKDYKILNPDDDGMDNIIKLSKSENLSIEQLGEIYSMMDSAVSSYEGRIFIKDMIVSGTGLFETFFDGTVNVVGRYPDFTGFSDKMDASLRKRKTETARIYQGVRDTIGLTPYTQVGLDLLMNGISTLKRNADSSTATQAAIRTSRNI